MIPESDERIKALNILARELKRYTSGECSSVKAETAQRILKSIVFTAELYRKSLAKKGGDMLSPGTPDIEEAYLKGKQLIKRMLAGSRLLLNAVKKNRLPVLNVAYNDTIDKALPEFFATYDTEYAAHEGNCLIDYPLAYDRMDTCGIEYISGYLNKLYHENMFCGKFNMGDIGRLIENLDPNYKEAYLNIFEPVLINSLGSVILGKSAYTLGLSYPDFADMQKKLGSCGGRQELDVILRHAADRMLTELGLESAFLYGYVYRVLPGISARLYYAVSHNGAIREIYFPG